MKIKAKPHEKPMPSDQAYFDRLHDKIMAQVEEAEMEPPIQISASKKIFIRSTENIREHLKGLMHFEHL